MNARPTIREVEALLAHASASDVERISRELEGDGRAGVAKALSRARARIERERAAVAATHERYEFMRRFAPVPFCAGLDEVGRGPLAGPLTVACVVLPDAPEIVGLDDSKKLSPARREELSDTIRAEALAFSVVHVPPTEIDARGIGACLRGAFAKALAEVEECYPEVQAVLLDGVPLEMDAREHAVVSGDGLAASIGAASILAKVARDAVMVDLDADFPGYGFADNKGYGSAEHIRAIKELGPTPVHRLSFCRNILEDR